MLAGKLEDLIFWTEKTIEEGTVSHGLYMKAFILRERRIFDAKQIIQGDLVDQRMAVKWLGKALET